jgi:hypothetical protein
MKLRYLVAAICLTSLPCVLAHADTITQTQTYSIATQTMISSENFPGAFFSNFNPSMGTLTSMTISLTGSATVTAYLNDPSTDIDGVSFSDFEDNSGIGFGLTGPITGITSSPSGLIDFNVSQADTFASDLAAFTQPGSTNLSFILVNQYGIINQDTFPVQVNTSALTETITYNYIPSVISPAPEPSSIALLTTGLGSLGFFRRRIAKPASRA